MTSGLSAEMRPEFVRQKIRQKIRYVKIAGITGVIGLWVLAMTAFLGHLPKRVFWQASGAEIVLASLINVRIRSLRKPRNDRRSERRL